jgi:hypothetical protein
MSNLLASATATATLARLAQQSASLAVPGAKVTTERPEAGQGDVRQPGVNLFLDQVAPSPSCRNADPPTQREDGTLAGRPGDAVDGVREAGPGPRRRRDGGLAMTGQRRPRAINLHIEKLVLSGVGPEVGVQLAEGLRSQLQLLLGSEAVPALLEGRASIDRLDAGRVQAATGVPGAELGGLAARAIFAVMAGQAPKRHGVR